MLVIGFAPRGVIGIFRGLYRGLLGRQAGGGAWLSGCWRLKGVSRRFGGLLAVDTRLARRARRPYHRSDRPERRRQDHLVRIDLRLPRAECGRDPLRWRDDHRAAAAPSAPAAASPARSRSCSPSPACRCARISPSARTCAIARRAEALAAADLVGREVGLGGLLDRPADTLTVAGRKRLEFARALATEPKLLLLDEVLAGLNPTEIREIVPVIRRLCDRGITIMMIEHVMQAVMSLSEHVFVLAEGRIIAEGTPAEVAADRAVIEAYLGHGAAKKLGGGA